MAGRKNSLRANTISQGLPVAAGYALNILSTPIVVHQLGLQAFGIWAITVAVAQYGAVFDFGISRSVTRFVALHHARQETRAERQVLTIAIAVLASLGLLLLALAIPAGLLAEGLGAPDAGSNLAVLAAAAVVVLVSGLLGRAFASLAFGRGRMVALNLALATSNGLMALTGVVALLIEPSLTSFALGTALGAVLGLLGVVIVLRVTEADLAFARPDASMFKEIAAFGLRGQSVLVADLVVFQSSKLIIGAVLGASAAGIYELGSRLALGGRTFGSLASTTLTPVITTTFSTDGIAGVREKYEALARRTVAWGAIWPLLVAGAGPSLIPLWLGDTPEESVLVVTALSFGFAINVATGTATVAALSVGRADVIARSALGTTVIFIIPVVPLTLAFGVPGAVLAVVTATVLGAAYGVHLSCAAVDASPRSYYRAIGWTTAGGLVAAAVSALVTATFFTEDRVAGAIGVIVSSLIVTVGCLASSRVRGPQTETTKSVARV
jgi:O-antigen/teichoic acid export membrane protein